MMFDESKIRLVIEGGVPLIGEVSVSGSKNAALPILSAAVLMSGEFVIRNVPNLLDIQTMIKMLTSLGINVTHQLPDSVRISPSKKIRHVARYDLVTAMRASFVVAGPVLARTGLAKVPLPGGCAIGSRPLDLHIKGFKAMGADVSIQHGFVEMRAERLKGARIYLDFPSVGATENIMMAATLAEGTTIIENAAREPEVVDLGNFLVAAGAKIEGVGSSTITIQGVSELKGVDYSVIPDRVESGTLMIAAAITGGDVMVRDVVVDHLDALLSKLRDMGLDISVLPEGIRVKVNQPLSAVDIETLPYPGFPTDMQAQMMSLLTAVSGTGVVIESIFENRFMHAQELMRMGADIRLDKNHAIVTGVSELSGTDVKITDLRAGAALVLAGLAADGTTVVSGLSHLRRGYDRLPQKLSQLGARIVE